MKNDKSIRSLAQKAAEAARAVHEAVLASSYDAQNVKDLAAKAQTAEAEVVTASIEAWTQIRSILTEDQASALKDAMSALRRGPGQAPPGPPPGEAGAPPPPPPPQ